MPTSLHPDRWIPLVALLFVGLAVGGGCGSIASMPTDAEPFAAGALEDIEGLPPYLEAMGLELTRFETSLEGLTPQIERVSLVDFGNQGSCSIRTYYTAEGAKHFGPRSTNEVRDLRGPIETNISLSPPSGRPDVPHNPTFLYGRHIAICSNDAAPRRAFKALEVYARAEPAG